MMRRLLLLLFIFPCTVGAQAWSGILATGRAVDWTQAGVPGGIPSAFWVNCTTSACNTAFSSPTASNLNAAIASAPANTVVRIPSGTYTISSSVFGNVSNVVLRGAGPTHTTIVLNGNNILFGSGTGGQGSDPGTGLATKNISGSPAQGTTVLTLNNTSGLSVGQVVQIDQLNAAYVNPVGNEGNENPGRCPSPLGFEGCSNGPRAQLELVEITNINSGANQITIAAPGLGNSYSSGLTPQVFYWTTTGIGSNDGVENMTVDAGDGSAGHAESDFAVALSWCNFCWVKNVAVINGHRAGLYGLWAYRQEFRDSYVSESNMAGAPTEYGIECDTCTFAKIENNILFGITSPILIETSYGVVAAYNYMLNTSSGNQFPNIDTHRSHDWLQLWEGNVVGTAAWDNIWGSGSQNTLFRNRSSGNDPNKTNYQLPVADSAFNRYANIVANVLGDPTFHLTYECTNTEAQPSNNFIYEIGFFNRCELGNTSYDATTLSSLMRWGNWDSVTYCTNGGHGGMACGSTGSNGIRYCTASATGNPACTTSETGSTDPTFPGLASPSESFPASFYLSTQPSWFATPYGTPPWPPIGPDVSGGNISNTAGHANQIPAQLCYNNTAKNVGGFLTAFDANVCYPSVNVGPPPAPLLSEVIVN